MFFFKSRAKMEQSEPLGEPQTKGADGTLKELTSKWFLETQVPFILHNGIFPVWFLGFISRRDAEEKLQDKEVGCFLIRLSDKNIGYILSYRGRERCRHFVINQTKSGQFIICGDTEEHNSLSDLIEYYKMSPIEPFGEYLTTSCFEVLDEDLYDTIHFSPKEKPEVTARTGNNGQNQHISKTSEQPPALPPKSIRSYEETPPLPRRARPVESDPVNDQKSAHDGILYAQLEKHLFREMSRAHQESCQENLPRHCPGRPEKPTTLNQGCPKEKISVSGTVYSELSLLDSKSRSLPLLDSNSAEERSYKLNPCSLTPPRLSPRPLRQAVSHGPQVDKRDMYSRPMSSHSLNYLCDSPLYHLAGRPDSPLSTSETRAFTSEQNNDPMYAEVPGEAVPVRFHLDRYEQKRGYSDAAKQPNSNTYESLEDLRPKHTQPSWATKNDKRKRVFPEVKWK
ncbi:SH2 domain-containing protein 7-like [Myripristis murdjan]|uniref:SH2 domain-containing protein 7-like n=1 Tax=Myripristis murdjan TaxID=586833 RepID=UPI001175D87E|nr:SH2 domain-containing protein 7-like [Myripristis murdjan]